MQLTLKGDASQKSWSLEVNESELELTVLEFLRKHNIPVASSCDGEEVCRLCLINEDQLACGLLVKDIIQKYNSNITISYL
ncbi:hypothetical protein ABMA70_00095 [Halobacteriovorax sp. XZX-3]|uniref:hypothetical protein n=1 Tax=unclassified Halobacteriovorax TaxID=2639665 RepID=UPI000CD18F18|nr:hypothetical protein [Halobacteriovorax sp. DA5]POB14173.1 hypothetical protein C0Z22_03535 [Halobacteriovorax sp. DA5]